MGLGKTVVTLALLADRVNVRRGRRANREDNHPRRPTMIVAPRSLIFNWKDEAARFLPTLRILDYTGKDRQIPKGRHAGDFDVLLTTYGTLRQDAARLKDIEFD